MMNPSLLEPFAQLAEPLLAQLGSAWLYDGTALTALAASLLPSSVSALSGFHQKEVVL